MDDKQFNTIIALTSGLEMAIAHLIVLLDAKGHLSRDEIAASFREVGEACEQAPQSQATAIVFREIANGIQKIAARQSPSGRIN